MNVYLIYDRRDVINCRKKRRSKGKTQNRQQKKGEENEQVAEKKIDGLGKE